MWGQLSFPVRQTLPILTTLVEGVEVRGVEGLQLWPPLLL